MKPGDLLVSRHYPMSWIVINTHAHRWHPSVIDVEILNSNGEIKKWSKRWLEADGWKVQSNEAR